MASDSNIWSRLFAHSVRQAIRAEDILNSKASSEW